MFPTTSLNETEEKTTKTSLKFTHSHPDHTHTWGGVLSSVYLKRTCRSVKEKHPEWQRKGKTCKSISTFPGAVWCYTLSPTIFFFNSSWRQRDSSLLRWTNTQLSEQWMAKKVQDISCMTERNCVNIFLSFKGMFLLMSCELVIRLSDWSLPCKATSLPDAYCLIHSNTHLNHTYASSSECTHFLSDSLTSNRQHGEPEGAKRPTYASK